MILNNSIYFFKLLYSINELQEKGRSTLTFTYVYYLKDETLCAHVECTVDIRPQGYMEK